MNTALRQCIHRCVVTCRPGSAMPLSLPSSRGLSAQRAPLLSRLVGRQVARRSSSVGRPASRRVVVVLILPLQRTRVDSATSRPASRPTNNNQPEHQQQQHRRYRRRGRRVLSITVNVHRSTRLELVHATDSSNM